MKGIYVLIINIQTSINIKIGALGKITFPSSKYAYVGSAQGSIENRVKRHIHKEKQPFWHIDYLLADPTTEVTQIYYLTRDKTHECKTAQIIAQHSKSIPKFGCSDCYCNSHLFYADNFGFLKNYMKQLTLS